MTIRQRLAKLILKRIEKYEKKILKFQWMIKKIRIWIKSEKKVLNNYLKYMTCAEYIQFGYDTGYLNVQPKRKKQK